MSSPRPDAPASPAPPALPRVLSTLDGMAIAISNVGPTLSLGVGLGILVPVVGVQMPAVFLVAVVPILGIAASYVFLSREEPNCGTSYVWLRTAFSPWIGYLAGFFGVAGAVAFLAYGGPLAGQITVSILDSAGVGGSRLDPENPLLTTVVGLGWLALATWLAVRGTDLAAKVAVWVVGIEVAILAVIGGTALVAGDASPVRASWFDPTAISSPTALVGGLVLAVFVFWGWDSAFNVNEETGSPAEAARAGIGTILIVVLLFVFASITFLRAMTPDELEANGSLGLPYLGGKMLGPVGEALGALALLLSAVAVLQAVVIATPRITLAMGRDGTLGETWTRLHPRHRTPAVGTVRLVAVAAAIAIASTAAGSLQTVITGTVSALGILIASNYALAGLAAAWRFRGMVRSNPPKALLTVALPLLSALVLAGVAVAFVVDRATSTDHWALNAENGWFLLTIPLVILGIGLASACYARFVRRPAYFTDPEFRSAVTAADH